MGLLDSLKRDKKSAETTKRVETSAESENSTSKAEPEINIEDIEVVEREVHPRVEHQAVATPGQSARQSLDRPDKGYGHH